MIAYDWQYNAPHRRYILKVENCTGYEAAQIVKHPAIDQNLTRFFNPNTGKMQCWLRTEYAHDHDSMAMTIDWIEEDVLTRPEQIKYDWSAYLDFLENRR